MTQVGLYLPLFLIFPAIFCHNPVKTEESVTNVLNKLLTNYDPRLRPDFLGAPTQVRIDIQLKEIDLLEADMELRLDFYIRQMWTDSRLTFNLSDSINNYSGSHRNDYENSEKAGKIDVLTLTPEFTDMIWTPDTFFRNEKYSTAHFSKATDSNRFFRLFANGTVKTSTRVTVRTSCHMDFSYFPMDKQVCVLDIGSFGYTTEDLLYFWSGAEDYLSVDLSIESLSSHNPMKVQGHQKFEGTTTTNTGTYSALGFKLLFVRPLAYFLVVSYLPSTVVTCVAYFSLWMSRNGYSNMGGARIGLGITSVLTMVTIYIPSNSNSNLGHVNCLKANDIYLGICFLFVFATLLESCVVTYLHSSWLKRNEGQLIQHYLKNQQQEQQPTGFAKLDCFCRIMLPITFGCFQIFYWTFLYFLTKIGDWDSAAKLKDGNWTTSTNTLNNNVGNLI